MGRSCVVVKIVDENGNVGWGQSVPSHTWSYETLETVKTTIDGYLTPALKGQDAFDAAAIQTIMDRTIAPSFSTGQPICKAGIDLALFDLTGRILGQSAAQRWGRESRSKITISWTLNPKSLGELPGLIEQAHERGFRRFNVKIGGDVKFDIDVCREIRRLAPDAFVWVDANGGYDLETALAAAPAYADLGMAALEQPLPANRLSWYRKLNRQGALPILMDEPIVSAVDVEEFHRLGLLDGVAMKVSRCGGLTEARKVLDYVEQNGLLFFASGLTDPDLSFAASLVLFGAYQLDRPAALNAPQFLTGSLLEKPIEVIGDQAAVPAGPGLGVAVDPSKLPALQNPSR
jgi:L-alanine-DL-glutamate epimerase-like enolase superfamily enzyme